MEDHRRMFHLEPMCRVLHLSRSSYYHWRSHQRRTSCNEELVNEIRRIHEQSRQTYGSPRMTHELRRQGKHYNRKRIARLMRQEGIRAKTKRRFKVTTHATTVHPVAENLVRRQFVAERTNEIWTSDMTYVWTREGWLYVAVVLDVCSRRIVGYAMSNRLTAALVTSALEQALTQRSVSRALIFHSDRGSQYASSDVRQILKRNNIQQSMSSTGNCYDNAITETFFHTLKTELTFWERYQTREEARRNIFEYIEVFYNRQRLHSALGYKPPVEFEQQFT